MIEINSLSENTEKAYSDAMETNGLADGKLIVNDEVTMLCIYTQTLRETTIQYFKQNLHLPTLAKNKTR